MNIRIAESEEKIEACYPVIRQLRPHLTLPDFVAQVQRQHAKTGYCIAYIQESDRVVAVAGYLYREMLGDGVG